VTPLAGNPLTDPLNPEPVVRLCKNPSTHFTQVLQTVYAVQLMNGKKPDHAKHTQAPFRRYEKLLRNQTPRPRKLYFSREAKTNILTRLKSYNFIREASKYPADSETRQLT
jgi:hypothetical protein